MSTEVLTISPGTFAFEQILNDEMFVSMTGAIQVQGRTGNRWLLSMMFPNLRGSDLQAVTGHAFQLQGRVNRLQVNMSTLNYSRAGTGGGTPLLVGVHSAGARSLSIDGATPTITNWLKASDRITIGNELKIVTQAVSTNGAGVATIPIWPELHQNRADNFAVEISAPFGVFFLREPMAQMVVPSAGGWLAESITLNLEEDVLA